MKKVFLTLFAVLLAVPAFAVEVYNNGDNSVGIYGHVRGYMGYGMGMNGGSFDNNGTVTTVDPTFDHKMFYGLQGNTRIGTNIKLGNFTAQFELGANEKTMVNQGVAEPTKPTGIGIRQAWGAYTFGNGSRLLFGKTDTPTAMGGFNSSFYDTDGGLNGFGGTVTGSRRFQVQYSIAGLTLALIEDDVNSAGAITSINGFTDNAPYTPRAGISYVFQNESLLAKIAATYTAVNGSYTDAAGATKWTNLHAFGVTLGVKPTFGNMWVSILARYGMNEDLYDEGKTVANTGSYAHEKIGYTASLSTKKDGSFNNIHRAGAALEFGMKATEAFTFIIGGGYQATIPELEEVTGVEQSSLIHSYAVFLQGQYALSPNFALVPEIAWFGTVGSSSSTAGGVTDKSSNYQNGLLVGLQFRANF